jgi:hypothetical protein
MEDELLIEAVRKQIIIYDISSLAYRNMEKKKQAGDRLRRRLDSQVGVNFYLLGMYKKYIY